MSRETPEFIAYALVHDCALRSGRDPHDPLQVERCLRPLRAYSEAVADDRIRDGIVIDRIRDDRGIDHLDACGTAAITPQEPRAAAGFRADEMLAAYGGLEQITHECGECPACVAHPTAGPRVAGCFGWIVPDSNDAPDANCWSRAIRSCSRDCDLGNTFLSTNPPWYGLWAQSPLSHDQLHWHRRLATACLHQLDAGFRSNHHHIDSSIASNIASNIEHRMKADRIPHDRSAGDFKSSKELQRQLRDWHAALDAAIDRQLELRVLLIPRGRVEGRRWTVAAHCEQCHAPRTSGSIHCPTCAVRGRVIAERTRCARGTRPFQPLETILGAEGARRFREKHAFDR